MKILYIADSTSIHTKRWVHYFIDAGHDVSIITIGQKREKLPGVDHLANFRRFYYKDPSFLSVLRKARRLIHQAHPDILHAHFVHQYGWLGALSGFHPFVLTAWGTDILNLPHASRSGIGKLLTKYSLKKADLLTGTSEFLRQEMIRLGANIHKVHVIFWGVNPDKFRPDLKTKRIRQDLRIGDLTQVIYSNRNHIALYNNDIVIEAMCRVLTDFPDTILILQNAGGILEEHLKNLAEKRGISKAVIFLPQYEHNALPPLYALADIYVSVPSWDAGPVSLKEAMACNATPIISAISGPMEWISHDVNGKVVPVRDVQSLAQAIYDLLSNEKKRESFNKINRQLIEQKGDQRVLMKRVEQLYKGLLQRGT